MCSSAPSLAATLLGTGACFPGRLISTAEVVARCMPDRDAGEVARRTGIRTRWWHDPAADTVASVSAAALARALDAAGLEAGALRRVILVNSHGFDTTMPPTANAVLSALGLHDTADGFDLNNACVGFLSGLDLAARCVATGLYPVAVVATELATRVTTPDDPRPYLVMGDGAAQA